MWWQTDLAVSDRKRVNTWLLRNLGGVFLAERLLMPLESNGKGQPPCCSE